MSTLAEHIVAIEFYRANYVAERQAIKDALHGELFLLASAHLGEIASLCTSAELTNARLAWAEKMRGLYGEAADPLICRWFSVPRADTAAAGVTVPDAKTNRRTDADGSSLDAIRNDTEKKNG